MKLRFLDARNCYSLLPQVREIPLARLLDEYLRKYVNDTPGELHGSVDALIQHNERTQNHSPSIKRLCNSPIEIALAYKVASREVDVMGLKKPWPGKALYHMVFELENGMFWKTVVPLQYLLKGWGDANKGYQCYCHSISYNMDQVRSYADLEAHYEASDDYHYVGITSRNWLHRFREHMGEVGRRSRLRFHTAWRGSMGKTGVHFVSQLGEINLTEEVAMTWEEFQVDRLGSQGLNMIPGGRKGLKYLHEHRITDRINISIEERDTAIAEFIRRNPRKGIPNPFIAELWKDDEFYLKVIGGRSNTLSASQVIKIRELERMGRSIPEITVEVGARNEAQVKRVIAGKTYRRI